MAQTNYTPISLYYSTTASAVPTAANLVPGELAINTNDGKLYYEDSSGVVQVLATKSTGSIGGSNTQVQFNNSGSLGGSSSFTWDGTTVTATKFAGALNGTVGATTASTGAFTTLSTSSTTTLSGLTASTALALDASKNVVSVTNTGTGNNVLSASPTLTGTIAGASLSLSSLTSGRVTYATTSGLLSDSSKLTFDTSNLTVGVIGLTANADGATGKLVLRKPNEAVGNNQITRMLDFAPYYSGYDEAVIKASIFSGVDTGTQNGQLGFMVATGGVLYEKIRLLANGNLGIGTSSAQASLNVADASSANNGTIWLGSATYYGTIKHNATGTGANEYNVATASAGGHLFQRGGTTLMNLDSSGNLGLGVTPSAWSGYRALQIGSTTSLWSGTSGNASSFYTNNGYFNGTNRIYLTTGYATEYIQGQGQHIWYNAPSGTAGNAITFTPAMTLDASGRLGIGTSSPPQLLSISGASNPAINVTNTAGPSSNFYCTTTEGVIGTNTGNAFAFHTSNTERMRITAAGLVSITGAGTEVLALNKLGGVSAYLQPVSNTDASLQVKDSGGAVTLTVGTSGTTVALQGGTVSSGTGIAFPATQVASANANTLDDYEEGTFTVGLTAGTSGSITTSTQSGTYTKVGRQVTVNAFITVASVSTPVGLLRMTGLPFANGTTRCAVSIWPHSLTASAATGVVGFIQASESTVILYVYTAGNGAVDMASYVQAGTNLAVSATYFV